MKKPRRERPIAVVWNGQGFIPLPRFKRMCDEQFAVNEEYAIIKSEERNMTRHRGYFAALKDAFDNLAEEYANGYPSPDHLRGDALIEAGYCTMVQFECKNHAAALTLGREMRKDRPVSRIRIHDDIVIVKDPLSQSVHSMGKEQFEASCKAVLEIVASMARTTVTELKKNAGRAA
jgi:hypothetical protein